MTVEREPVRHRHMAERYPPIHSYQPSPLLTESVRVTLYATPLQGPVTPVLQHQNQASRMWLFRGQTMSKATAGVTSVLRDGTFSQRSVSLCGGVLFAA